MGLIKRLKRFFRGNRPKTAQDSSPLVDPEHPPGYCVNDPVNSQKAGTKEGDIFPLIFQDFLEIWGKPNPHLLANRWDIFKELPGLGNVPQMDYTKKVIFFLKVLSRKQATNGKFTLQEVKEMLEC